MVHFKFNQCTELFNWKSCILKCELSIEQDWTTQLFTKAAREVSPSRFDLGQKKVTCEIELV